MGWSPLKLTPALAKRIAEAQKLEGTPGQWKSQAVQLGKSQALADSLPTPKYLAGEEKKLQQDCENYLRQRDIFYLRMPFGKATGIRCGFPDFAIFIKNYECVLVEMKVQGGRLSEDQEKLHDDYWRQTGQTVKVVTSFAQFVELIATFVAACNDCATPQTHSTYPPPPTAS